MSSINTIPITIQQYIPRPMNAFMCFAQYHRSLLKKKLKISSNSNISKELGNIWQQMSLDQQLPFMEQSAKIREDHQLKYPFYKYRPRTKKNRVRKMPVRGVIETYKPTTYILKKKNISKKVNIQSPETETEEEEMDWFEYIQNEDWLK